MLLFRVRGSDIPKIPGRKLAGWDIGSKCPSTRLCWKSLALPLAPVLFSAVPGNTARSLQVQSVCCGGSGIWRHRCRITLGDTTTQDSMTLGQQAESILETVKRSRAEKD